MTYDYVKLYRIAMNIIEKMDSDKLIEFIEEHVGDLSLYDIEEEDRG